MKAFAYLCVSGVSRTDDDEFVNQLHAVEKHASAFGYQIVAEFQERLAVESVAQGRPTWSEMVRQCELTGVWFVLVEKLSRVATGPIGQEIALFELSNLNISVVSSAEPDLCSGDPARVLIRNCVCEIARYNKCSLVLRLRSARERKKAETGFCMGRKPFGHYPGESDTLLLMAELFQRYKSFRAVATDLNQRGIATRFNGAWHAKTIANILGREGAPALIDVCGEGEPIDGNSSSEEPSANC
jgi:DNA invertase Pin-like site-specific DNA recombinase